MPLTAFGGVVRKQKDNSELLSTPSSGGNTWELEEGAKSESLLENETSL